MDVLSLGPLRVGSVLWQPRRGTWALTVVCKATYALGPVESPLAREQEYPNEDDNHWNDDAARSLYSPIDLVPFKPRADVVLVGHAFAPRKEPVRSLVARLIVGEINKAVEVYGERAWTQDGLLREGPRFVKMPLRYERASGGPDTINPVGVRLDARPDAFGNVQVPNLQPPGLLLSDPADYIEPVGFGPLAPSWPGRREKLGRHAGTFNNGSWLADAIPEDIDRGYFNVAPRDQQLEALRPNERIVLENLHPEHSRLVTNLAGPTPRAFVERRGTGPQELMLTADTLWIDTDRSIATLTWRGQVQLEHQGQPGRVLVAAAEAGQRLAWADVERMARGMAEGTEPDATPAAPRPPEPPKRPRDRRNDPLVSTTGMMDANLQARTGSTLPFISPASPTPFSPPPPARPSEPKRPPSPMRPRDRDTDEVTNVGMAIPSAGLPFAGDAPAPSDGAPAWLSQSRLMQSPAMAQPPPVQSPPPMGPPPPIATPFAPSSMAAPPPAPVPPPPIAAVPSDSPWAGASARTIDPAMPGMVGPSPNLMPSPSAPLPVKSVPQNLNATSSGLGPQVPQVALGAAAAVSVVAASNAAAQSPRTPPITPSPTAIGPSARGAVRPSTGREVVEVLWFDPKALPRIREHKAWKPILEELKPKPPEDVGFDDEVPPEPPPEVSDKRDVVGLFTRAEPADSEGINEAIEDAVSDEGLFEPPLVFLSGDLALPFDEQEMLKATVTAVTPFAASDKKLKETVDTANELLKAPPVSSSTAESLISRLKEAFLQVSRTLPAGYLETQTERVLLEQRHYQKRAVFGEPWIRALLTPSGGVQPLPAYLPEPLGKQLPLFQRLRARVIAEAHLQQDENETQPTALKVVALGRVVSLSGRRRS